MEDLGASAMIDSTLNGGAILTVEVTARYQWRCHGQHATSGGAMDSTLPVEVPWTARYQQEAACLGPCGGVRSAEDGGQSRQ